MIDIVSALVKTLFDIIRMHKGPDAIPYSPVLFVFVVAAWLVSGLPAYALLSFVSVENFWIDTAIGASGVAVYAVVVSSFGKRERLLQALTALLGCAVLLSLAFVAIYVSMRPFLGENLALVLGYLVILWSIAVDGHIVARTVDQEFYLGLLIAIGVFLMQLQIDIALKPPPPGAL